MCGRFALHAKEQEILDLFQLKRGFSMRARYNIAPSQVAVVIKEFATQVEFYQWGFIPPWVKVEANAHQAFKGHINAREESLLDKPTFKYAFTHQRCLIPANGYFEWRLVAGRKQPYYIQAKNQSLLAFAGIWSRDSFAIITQPAQGILQHMHERMPCIILPQHYQRWLAKKTTQTELCTILCAEKNSEFSIQAVTQCMNNPSFEGSACIQPLVNA